MKKTYFFSVFVLLLLISNINYKVFGTSDEAVKSTSYQNLMCSYNLLSNIKNQRETTYNALNLNTDQLNYKNELDVARYEKIRPLLEDLCKHHYTLEKLKINKASNSELSKQEKFIKNTKDEIKKISDDYDDKFLKKLDHNQKSKFSMIKSLQRNDYKKNDKIQQRGKKTSSLRTFGERISQPDHQKNLNKNPGNK